eukprot:scaffold499_cov129-Isochrysis_galbana.AAC.1
MSCCAIGGAACSPTEHTPARGARRRSAECEFGVHTRHQRAWYRGATPRHATRMVWWNVWVRACVGVSCSMCTCASYVRIRIYVGCGGARDGRADILTVGPGAARAPPSIRPIPIQCTVYIVYAVHEYDT